MVNSEDKLMKGKLPSNEELWQVITKEIRDSIVSLYEIETKCGKLLLVSNEVWYYTSEDIKNSKVKNILNERIRLLIYNRMMLFGLVTLEKTYYDKTPYFDIYYSNFDMSFSIKDLKQFEIEFSGIYDYIPKSSKKYDTYIRNKKNQLKPVEVIDINKDEVLPLGTLGDILAENLAEELVNKKIKREKELKKLSYEIQLWLESPPKTLSRLRKFFDSIVSIHLGGEGLMGLFHKEREKGTPNKDLKALVRNYKVNYPNKD